MTTLNEEFKILAKNNIIDSNVPGFVAGNLYHTLREYQEEALGRFFYYMSEYEDRKKPTQLLFEMATGSGKTLVMAGCILWLYKQGYRNFIFFTRLGNIIEKSKENFADLHSNKHVFDGGIEIDGQRIDVNIVDNFQDGNIDDINLVFMTTGKLHGRMNEPRENSLTLEDFDNEKVVLIGDEAHNLNAVTKSQSQLSVGDEDDLNHWETTINRIFKSNKENVLLEFTATANLDDEDVAEKYADKLLYTYSLKEFREKGYSKDVYMTISGADPIQRALQALILSQYRRKVAEANGIALKPVVLFKVKYIKDLEKLREDFDEMIKGLSANDIKAVVADIGERAPDLEQAFTYFNEHDISFDVLVEEIKRAFRAENRIFTHHKSLAEDTQKALNNLEQNHYRAVFAVDQLNEGWDVLNLFDIVKMDDSFTRNTSQQERQLIGRGARYCPFGDPNDDLYFKRKFDEETDNELRIIEKLNYHCQHEKSYITDLKKGLQEDGIMPKTREPKEVNMRLKDKVKENDFYQKAIAFENKQVPKELPNLEALEKTAAEDTYTHHLSGAGTTESEVFGESEEGVDEVRETSTRQILLSEVDENLLRGVLDRFMVFSFDSLSSLFPSLDSIEEFITADDYLAGITIEVKGEVTRLDNLTRSDMFKVLSAEMKKLAEDIQTEKTGYEGSATFYPVSVEKRLEDNMQNNEKTLHIVRTDGEERGVGMRETDEDDLRMDVRERDWYMFEENYGTSEEKSFVKFLDDAMSDLEKTFEDIYLLRNEKFFKLYDFDQGRRFEPDFLLFAKEKNGEDKKLHYQLFVDPKGEGWRDKDMWKQEFLEKIEEEFQLQPGFEYENKKFRLVGLPFYTENKNDSFEKAWDEFIS